MDRLLNEIPEDTYDMALLDDLAKSIKANEKEVDAQGRKLAYIEGQLSQIINAPKKSPNPYAVTAISILGAGILAFWSWTATTLVQHGNTLTGIRQSLITLGITVSANTPLTPKSQDSARAALAEAKKSSIRIPPAVVEQAGKSFIETSHTEPKAWDVAMQFIDYRSALNKSDLPLGNAKAADRNFYTTYRGNRVDSQPEPNMSVLGQAPPETGAKLERIAEPITQPEGLGNQTIIGTGGAFLLDGMRLKHVIFVNVEVHYRGSVAVLEDVVFINCHFVFDNTPYTRSLGEKILTSSKVTASLGAA